MQQEREPAVRSSKWLGIVNQDMKSEMKTPEQWLDIIKARGATTQPAGTLRLVRQIQDDALEYAVGLCIQHAHTGNPEGWTDTVSQECARIINSKRDA